MESGEWRVESGENMKSVVLESAESVERGECGQFERYGELRVKRV